MVSPVPLIITQHGSSRDGIRFPNSTGKTDEFSSRIIKTGIDRGFAVVAIDAFYKTDLKPNNKGQFPNAYQYALDLKHIFSTDPRFDSKNIFYTGFSYGARQVNKSVGVMVERPNSVPWRSVASIEPGCNVINEPIKVSFPILLIKGSESHYYPEPCYYFTEMVRKSGNTIKMEVINGANHFFSSNGRIINGLAFNGCRYNPVIKISSGSFVFSDGSITSREEIRQKCFTKEGGSGKDRVFLDGVVNTVVDFFQENIISK
ncbi:MAG: UBX domain protein [Alphaproteobacteria bacterium]|nr:UBX domain protein [Alphaproteobacteria bacterium]